MPITDGNDYYMEHVQCAPLCDSIDAFTLSTSNEQYLECNDNNNNT